jgi:hypothetical protein
MLSAHVGNIVCMAGRQTGGAAAASGVLELDTSDKQRVTVRGAAAAGDLSASPFLEVIGKVEPDHTLSYVSGFQGGWGAGGGGGRARDAAAEAASRRARATAASSPPRPHARAQVDHGCLGTTFDLDNYDAMVVLSHNGAFAKLHRV